MINRIKESKKYVQFLGWISIGLCMLLLGGCSSSNDVWLNLWLRPDQRGQRLMDRGRFEEAAKHFRDPMRGGMALFRAGMFKEAAASFSRMGSPEAMFNRGNSLVMAGKYLDAIASFDRALKARPKWEAPKINRKIARARWKKLNPEVSGEEGTGGKLEADEIVFDNKPAKASSQQEEVVIGDSGPMSDEELRALWLRRVQTRPADFLRAKFAYQSSRRSSKGSDK